MCSMARVARIVLLSFLVLCVVASSADAQSDAVQKANLALPLRIEGVAANSGGAWPFWKAGFCTVTIKQWSSDADLSALRSAIEKGGQKGLEKAIAKMPKIADAGGIPMAIAKLTPTDNGGSRLLLIMFRRTCNYNPREEEHLLGAVQIDLDAEGKGTGVLAGYTKVEIAADGSIGIEAIGSPCVVFKEMKVVSKKS